MINPKMLMDTLGNINVSKKINLPNRRLRVFWRQIVQGVLYQTPSGIKPISWDASTFTIADLIIDPKNTIQCYQAGIDEDHRAIEITEKRNEQGEVIGYVKTFKIENVLYDEIKITSVDFGLDFNTNPINNQVNELLPIRTVKGQIERHIDINFRDQHFGVIPRLSIELSKTSIQPIEDIYYLYIKDCSPVYNINNEFMYTEIEFSLVADMFGKSGQRINDFVREGGVGDGEGHPIEVQDEFTGEWFVVWDLNKLEPIGFNAYNLQLEGRGALSSFTVWGCDFTYNPPTITEINPSIEYGPHKILVGTTTQTPYTNPITLNPPPTNSWAIAEGCLLESVFFWEKANKEFQGSVDLNNQTAYQGDFVFDSKQDSATIGVPWTPIGSNPYKVKVGNHNDFTSGSAIKEMITSYGKPLPVDTDNRWQWDVRANPYFHNDVVGQTSFVWPNQSQMDFERWFMMNGLILLNMLEIPMSYFHFVAWGINDIPVLGPILNYLTGGFSPQWRGFSGIEGIAVYPIPMIMDSALWFVGWNLYNRMTTTAVDGNKGLMSTKLFDNTDDSINLVGQKQYTLSLYQIVSDLINIAPYDVATLQPLPKELVGTEYIGQTYIDPTTKKATKFYGVGLNQDKTDLNFDIKTSTPNKRWIGISYQLKAPAKVQYQLSFFAINTTDAQTMLEDYPNENNMIWQGTYQTNSMYRQSQRMWTDVVSLMSYSNTNLPPLSFPRPLIPPTPTTDELAIKLADRIPIRKSFASGNHQHAPNYNYITSDSNVLDIYDKNAGYDITHTDTPRIQLSKQSFTLFESEWVPVIPNYTLDYFVIELENITYSLSNNFEYKIVPYDPIIPSFPFIRFLHSICNENIVDDGVIKVSDVRFKFTKEEWINGKFIADILIANLNEKQKTCKYSQIIFTQFPIPGININIIPTKINTLIVDESLGLWIDTGTPGDEVIRITFVGYNKIADEFRDIYYIKTDTGDLYGQSVECQMTIKSLYAYYKKDVPPPPIPNTTDIK